jgi:arylsulfatase A
MRALKLLCITGLFVCSLFFNSIAQTGTENTKRPNIVIIYLDDLGYGDLSCYGASKIRTPQVDRLAREGIRFTNAHSSASTCTPSRYSLLTGAYAWRQKGTNILPGNAALIIPQNRANLASVLKKAGYSTAVVGKWHLGLGDAEGIDWNKDIKPGPNEIGFDYSYIFPATADRVPTIFIENHQVMGLEAGDPIAVDYAKKIGNEPTGRENPELLKMKAAPNHGHDGTIVNGIGRIGFMTGGQKARWADEEVEDVFLAQAKEYIRKEKDKPFFLYFSMTDIHVPRMPSTRFKGKSGLGYRGDAILQMDYCVGELLGTLDELKLTNNTIVIFTSDNGPVLNDGYLDEAVELLNGHKPNGPFRGGKYSVLEAGTRLPLIVRWPAAVKPGESDALVSQVDFLASFAAFTGQQLKPEDGPDSFDHMDVLLGKSKKGRKILVEQGLSSIALIVDNWKYIEPGNGPAVMTNVNIETGASKEAQLYDLKTDITESKNLASQYPERVKEMQAILKKLRDDGRSR